jgi:hypothetical protein
MAIPDPPAAPPGWEVAPPHFVGVGAQRSGTTWWWGAVIEHPRVCFRRGLHTKEVHFFDDLQDVEELDDYDAESYHRWFPHLPGAVIGEWTPRYMLDRSTARHIARVAPDARIMVILRDPVDRYVSGVDRTFVMARNMGVTPSPEEVAADQQARGLYFEQVRRVFDAFPREQVLILQYERCRADFEAELHRTYAFLGLEAAGVEPRDVDPREPRPRELPAEERERLAHVYAPDVRKLVEIAPEIDPEMWPSVRALA